MTTSRKWVLVSTLMMAVLAVDGAAIALVAHHARAWLGDGRAAAVARAGAATVRHLGTAGERVAARLGDRLMIGNRTRAHDEYAVILSTRAQVAAARECARCIRRMNVTRVRQVTVPVIQLDQIDANAPEFDRGNCPLGSCPLKCRETNSTAPAEVGIPLHILGVSTI